MHITVGLIEPLDESETKKLYCVGIIGYDTRTYILFFATLKYLDCMQHCMMLMEKYDRILANDLGIRSWLKRDQLHGGLFTDSTNLSGLRNISRQFIVTS